MNALLIVIFSILYPITHIANGWIFEFAVLYEHISLIYLPAFLRLTNVLVLGPRNGTLATLIGGLLLLPSSNDDVSVSLLNIVSSASGPLAALFIFKKYTHRHFELTSIKDLGALTVVYAMVNALVHHLVWSVIDTSKLAEPAQVLWMVMGDISGALLGAYLMKWFILKYRDRQISKNLMD